MSTVVNGARLEKSEQLILGTESQHLQEALVLGCITSEIVPVPGGLNLNISLHCGIFTHSDGWVLPDSKPHDSRVMVCRLLMSSPLPPGARDLI